VKSVVVIILFVFCHIPSAALASTVLQVTFEQLATSSELIFEGEAIASESTWGSDQSGIHTYVTFRVNEVIKGSAGMHVVLRFLGGTVGEVEMEISGSTLPEVGERGIYFVETLSRFQVNPLYGVDQGHFLVIESLGQQVMTTRSRQVITGFFSDIPVAESGLSNGIALGLSLEESGLHPSGVTAFQFKQKIREYVQDR
jgi:hypothetical protein